MGRPFIYIFNKLRKYPFVFYILLCAIALYAVFGIVKLKFNNDIFSIFPQHTTSKNYKSQVTNLRSNNNMLILLHVEEHADTSLQLLLDNAEWWENRLASSPYLSQSIKDTRIRMTDSLQRVLYDSIFYNLPLLLTAQDLDSLSRKLDSEALTNIVKANARMNNSFTGLALKYYNELDPLHLAPTVLKKLSSFRTVPSLTQANGFQISTDERNLLFDITAIFPDNEDPRYAGLIDTLFSMRGQGEKMFAPVKTYLIGAPIASEINKDRSSRDGNLTGIISIFLTMGLLYYFYRRKRLSLIALVPSVVGYAMALATFGYFGIPIVAMAMSSATIILAMGINYSIHLINARIHHDSIEEAISEISSPLLIGNVTTIAAFALLVLSDSLLLQQFSYLAVISLAVGVLTTLIVLPQWLHSEKTREREVAIKWFEKMTSYDFHKNKWIIGVIVLGTFAMIIPSSKIQFQGDLSKLNYIPDEDKAGFNIIENDLGFDLSRTSLQVKATNLDSALTIYGKARKDLLEMDSAALIPDITAIQPPASQQYSNSEAWHSFWSDSLKTSMNVALKAQGISASKDVQGFLAKTSMLDSTAVPERMTNEFKNSVLNRFIKTDENHEITINAPVIGDFDLEHQDPEAPYQLFNRQHFANQTAGLLQGDFNNILFLSALVVFLLLFIVYGRLELAILSFIPMAISWVWILGIAHLCGIQIHIVNLILCTFIFGLCDDYSIFMIDGLTKEFSTGKKVINNDKKVIVISVLVTMIGLAAMLFGKHPAFHSFAVLALVGLIVVLILSLTLQPALYHFFVTSRTEKGNAPMTLLSFIVTIVTFTTFIVLGILLSIIGLMWKWTGLMKIPALKYIFHVLIKYSCKLVLWITPTAHFKNIGLTNINWDRPGIVVSNHLTHIDLLLLIGLHPKLVVMTNSWVYNNPVYGGLVRAAGYLPGFEGTDSIVEKARETIDQGYSILVFPEGTRSIDGKIKRFHKGAFFLAEELDVPIYPVVLHGVNVGLTKGDQHIKSCTGTLNALPAINGRDTSWGESYTIRTKNINKMMREELDRIAVRMETPEFHFDTLRKNYLFKGPVTYWYAKIKTINENLYKQLNDLIPRNAKITDLGCGYGMMDLMLSLCSAQRSITGIDYDEDKIDLANNNFSVAGRDLHFINADIITYALEESDVFLLYDCLHYLNEPEQVELLKNCANNLNPQGMIIIREGVESSGITKHSNTKFTEWLSTKVFGFNKIKHDLRFINESIVYKMAEEFNFSVEKSEDSALSSNTLFIIKNQFNPV